MINYLGRYILNLTENTENLRKQLVKDTIWHFDENRKKEIDNLKALVTDYSVLKFYNPSLPIKVSCDAFLKGLGTVLQQKHNEQWHPVTFVSRSLNKSEQNYSQLEKEMLSTVFVCTKFHDYIYGKPFHIYNNHLPIKSIFNKLIVKPPPQIQSFLLRLQKQNFEMHYIQVSLPTNCRRHTKSSISFTLQP